MYDIQMSILDKAEANAIGKAVAVLRVWTKLNST
jgi:hypothetical protein